MLMYNSKHIPESDRRRNVMPGYNIYNFIQSDSILVSRGVDKSA